jgi:small subunit ribosomal protein S25e
MGGGKKRLTLKQMARTQSRKDQQRKERKSARSATEKKSLGLTLPDLKSKKVIGEMKTMKVLTPYTVASRFNLRLSVARDMLKDLERRKIVEYVSGGKNLKIYKPLN